uniref:ETS domain-containing protein n=1 Tax=Anopheles atroparvus TaxID=41427 RepID=A0A182IZ15_ANOAO
MEHMAMMSVLTPQTVPAGNYISDVYAPYAELFDLSLLPNDGEVPLSPQSQLQQSQQQAFGGPAQSPEYIPATIFHDNAGVGHDRHLLSPAYGAASIKVEYDSGAETSIDLDSLLGDSSPYHHSQAPSSPPVIKVESSNYTLPLELPQQQQQPQQPAGKPQGFQILREHLQDTSFQRRHNLKPLELDSLIGGLTTHADIGPVFEFALQEMKNGVQATCTELGISSDPKQWTTAKVHQWLELAMGKYFLPRLDNLPALFPENGAQLAALPLEEFVRRIPQGGDKLHGYLELWKQIHRLMVGDNATVDSMVTESVAIGGLSTLPPMGCSSVSSTLATGLSSFAGLSSEAPCDAGRMMPAGTGAANFGVGSGPTSTHSVSPTMLDNFDSDSMNGDASDDEDEDMAQESPENSPSAGGGPSTSQPCASGQSGPAPVKARHGGSHIHLWQFLKELLASPEQHQNAIRWIDRSKGVFKIEDSVRVARLWGRRKNRPAMNYDKLSRSIRQYYKKGIMQKTERSQRLVYQFCSPYAL